MTRVSKNNLPADTIDTIFTQLNQTLCRLKVPELDYFLSELLGPEERVLIAKRLAAIILLNHKQSMYVVAKKLNLSTSTADRLQKRLKDGEFDKLVALLEQRKRSYLEILDAIDSVLHLGGILPHYGQTHASEAYKKNVSINRNIRSREKK